MAIKFLAIAFFLALVVIEPVHSHFGKDYAPAYGNDTDAESMVWFEKYQKPTFLLNSGAGEAKDPEEEPSPPPTHFLWMYVVFVYLFTGIALYLIVTETKRIIRIRQDYLGSQSTITDRTIRLSGIPVELRTEGKIRETIERLEIGKIESLILCRDWKELDDLMDRRMQVLRKLEEAWTVHLGDRRGPGSLDHSNSRSANHTAEDEESQLLQGDENERSRVLSYARGRPTTRIWYGFLKLQSQKIDAIDYYDEKLRKLDEKIKLVRKKGFKPTPLAFVTFDSAASCVGSVLDPI
jgi:calcium permeable stress-gated cation channel